MPERLVVVGGDAGGMTAASQARRRRGPDDLEIVAFERGNYTSYSACGIPYFVGGVVEDLDELIARPPEIFRSDFAIDVRIRHEVTEIDLDKGALRVAGPDGVESWEGFDQLMIATGGVPVDPDLPGSASEGIFGIQTLDDGVEVKALLDGERPRRAVVIGGGYIGLEMAEALVSRSVQVTLVERAAQPMKTLDADVGELVRDALEDLGVTVHTSEAAVEFESRDGRVTGVITDRRRLATDVVILGLGTRPNRELAEAAGVPVGEAGGIAVDRRMHTRVERVWAAGDCAEKFHRISRRPVTIALGTHANKEGRVAGINIGGGYATFPGVVGTAVSKICGIEVARTGLNESEAAAAGFETLSVIVESTTRAGYYPGSAQIKTKRVVEKGSGRLLGAQIVGKEGAAKRIDVLAAALWAEMTADELLNLDLGYAPPFSALWDPVLIAARKAWQRVEETAADTQ